MKQKIIFLDFDGVLNSVRTVTANQKVIGTRHIHEARFYDNPMETGFDEVAVKLLKRAMDLTDAYIVISSSWRVHLNLETIRKMFHQEFGWPNGEDERIIGVTGRDEKAHRGTEIDNWINDHTTGIRNFKYVIIDDSSDLLEHQFKRFVQTCAYEGFLYKDYKKLLDLFDTKDEEI